VVEDVDHYQVVSRYIRDKGLHSLAGVPLQIDGRLIGVLHVGSMRPRKFQQQEVELLRLAGDRIALAIERTEVRAAAAAAAETVERSGKAQKHLIEDLLDVSRVVAGKLRIDAQPVELAEVIEAAVNVVGPAAGAKSVELESMLRGFRHGRVLGDPGRLQQMVG